MNAASDDGAPWTVRFEKLYGGAARTRNARECAMRDIAAEVASLELDHLRDLIRRVHSDSEFRRHRGYRQYASTVGDQLPVIDCGARVENLHANQPCSEALHARLQSATKEKLIEVIERLATDSEDFSARIDYLTDPGTAAKMLQRRISSIRNRKRFVSYAEVRELAGQLASQPRQALAGAKRAVVHALESSFEEALEFESYLQEAQTATPEFAEGVAAFLARRSKK